MTTPRLSKSSKIPCPSSKHVSLAAGGAVVVGVSVDALIKRAPASKSRITESQVRCLPFASLSESLVKKNTMSSCKNGRVTIASSSEVVKTADTRRVSPWGQAICGALAGAVARCIVAPLDVVKIRYDNVSW
eukprot:9503284-Pyramimonas_sp.AAC.2